MNVVNLLQIESDEKVTSMLAVRDFEEDKYVVLVTRQGTVKRMAMPVLQTARKAGIRAIGLEDGDALVSVLITGGSDNILIATRDGAAIRFAEQEVRPMGRDAFGVRGIRLRDGDWVVGADRESAGEFLLTVTEKGYGKLTPCEDYTIHHRASSGVTAHNLTDKTGGLIAVRCVNFDDDLLVMTSEGVVIRMAAGSIRICGRASQGVILVKVGAGGSVIDVALTGKDDETAAEEADSGAPAEESTDDAPDAE